MSEKQPYLASPLTNDVVANAKQAIEKLRNDPASKHTLKFAVNAIHDITEVSLKYYFFRPMDEMEIGMISRNIVKMGVNSGLGLLNTFGSRLLNSLSNHQRVMLADHIEAAIIYMKPDDLPHE